MRLWEFNDDRATPLNLVYEQDFILQIRRLKRIKIPHIVICVLLSKIAPSYKGRGSIEEAHSRLINLSQSENGKVAPMTNGDVFITWPLSDYSAQKLEEVQQVTLPEGFTEEDRNNFIQAFKLPDEYMKLREHIDTYLIPPEKRAKEFRKSPDCVRLLMSEKARGELSAWTLDQIENLCNHIDIHHYIRSQPIYELKDDTWTRLGDETYISVEEVRQKYFSHTIIEQPQHLFLALCQSFDKKLFENLATHYNAIQGMNLHLNVSLRSVLGVTFARFTHAIPKEEHRNFSFEIHCGDLMQDFEQTLGSIETLRNEGYHILIDGITPKMLTYFNFDKLQTCGLKIKVGKDHAKALEAPEIQEAIKKIPPQTITFYHCDNARALETGKRLGIKKYQGFLVDELALGEMGG